MVPLAETKELQTGGQHRRPLVVACDSFPGLWLDSIIVICFLCHMRVARKTFSYEEGIMLMVI